jgi:hypothetical protein
MGIMNIVDYLKGKDYYYRKQINEGCGDTKTTEKWIHPLKKSSVYRWFNYKNQIPNQVSKQNNKSESVYYQKLN